MSAGIRLETAGSRAELVGPGNGLTEADLQEALPRAERAQRDLLEARDAGLAGFLDLPLTAANLQASVAAADTLRGRCRTLVVVGMGGSAQGARALVSALAEGPLPGSPRDGAPRVVVLDSCDPAAVVPLLESLEPETTFWNIVSKSGSTLEVQAVWGAVRPHLERSLGRAWVDHVIVTTDTTDGPLRDEAARAGLAMLEVPADVGGRWSVFSPVGLFPAAVAGIDVRGLLRGASEAATAYGTSDPRRNDALDLALRLVLLAEKAGRTHHVVVPYRRSLAATGPWWTQLWCESLGKQGLGFDATAGEGSAVQHSLLQLWMEGPRNKAFVLVHVDDPGEDRVLDPPPPGARWLGRRTLGDAQRALADGTATSLAEAGHPVLGIRLRALDAASCGAYLQMWMTATALAGPLLGVSPFGQPGVETGKRNARALLGHGDETDRRGPLEDLLDRLRGRR